MHTLKLATLNSLSNRDAWLYTEAKNSFSKPSLDHMVPLHLVYESGLPVKC